jgi:hypothetical protein
MCTTGLGPELKEIMGNEHTLDVAIREGKGFSRIRKRLITIVPLGINDVRMKKVPL